MRKTSIFQGILKERTKICFCWNLLAGIGILLSNVTPVFCNGKDLTSYGANGINVLAYIFSYGAQWLWLAVLATFTISLGCSGQAKQIFRGLSGGLLVAWIICVVVSTDPSAVSNTFDVIRDKFIGKGNSSGGNAE